MTDPRDPSRREFLAASAIGLIGLGRDSESTVLRDEAHPEGDLLYVGTYTEGDQERRDLSAFAWTYAPDSCGESAR